MKYLLLVVMLSGNPSGGPVTVLHGVAGIEKDLKTCEVIRERLVADHAKEGVLLGLCVRLPDAKEIPAKLNDVEVGV